MLYAPDQNWTRLSRRPLVRAMNAALRKEVNHMKVHNQKASDDEIISAYEKYGSVWKSAEALGMCGQSVHERLVKLGKAKHIRIFTDEEREYLLSEYVKSSRSGKLQDLADRMGRTKQFICRQAKILGLTDTHCKRPYNSEKISISIKEWHNSHEHPRGMLGKHQSKEERERMSIRHKMRWAKMTEDERSDLVLKIMKNKVAKYGSMVSNHSGDKRSWKAAWRTINGTRIYFRSSWEANYGRYLEWLKENGVISKWEHEPITFWFKEIKRGKRSYLPDFRVTENDGRIVYHEVKGWMDQRSKTALSRMKKYYPDVELIVIASKEYASICKKVGSIIPGWE